MNTAEAHPEIEAFWEVAKRRAKLANLPGYFGPSALESLVPPAWSFGDSAELADELLALVLDGRKTATSSALWDYEAEDEELPEPGNLSIVLDGAGIPRALIVVTAVEHLSFAEVSEEQARAEGEGDLSLAHWRAEHERFFREAATHDRGFSPEMPVVFETFEVLYQS